MSEDEEYICDYTGEYCIGNPNFCEECPIVLESEAEGLREDVESEKREED